MSARAQVFFDAGSLAHGELAPDEATHLTQYPCALRVLGPADRAVGVRIEVLGAQAVAGPQGDNTDAVGGQSHGVGDGGRRSPLDSGLPEDLLVTLGKPSKGAAHEGMVDAGGRVVCRRGRCCGLQRLVLGGNRTQLAASMVDGDGAHCRQEVRPEVGQRALTGPDEVIDPKAGLGDDVLGRGPPAVAVGDAIGRREVAAPQLGIRLGVAITNQGQEGAVISVNPSLPPQYGWRGHVRPLPSSS
jgi:hypothetical protein